MDPLVFWNKLQKMSYDEIIHWIEVEEVRGVPEYHDACLLAELGWKVTGSGWSFARDVYSEYNKDAVKVVLMGEVTAPMEEVMNKFDQGLLEEFVKEGHVRT